MYISLKFFTGIITASTTGISPNTTITGTGITPPTNGKLVYQDIIKVTAVVIVVTLLLLILVVIILHLLKKLYKKNQKANFTKKAENKDTENVNNDVGFHNNEVYAVVKKDKAPELPPTYLLSEDTIDLPNGTNQQEQDHILNNPLYEKNEATEVYSHVYDDTILQLPVVYDSIVDMTEFNVTIHKMPDPVPTKLQHVNLTEFTFITDDVYDDICSVPVKLQHITQENIKMIKLLGIGQFGEVILAETVGLSLKDLRMSPSDDDKSISVKVAVKMKEDSDPKSWEAFDKEVKFMSQLDHINVIRLLAVSHSSCTEHFIVMEYMENGELNHFLLNRYFSNQHPPPSTDQLSPQILLSMCIQIANGMTYLAFNNYIHRDLASRNCLVGQNYVIKIGDFGLSRDLYDSAYYCTKGKAKVPIRWMPTECYYGKFSEKSDVWAYGVTVWEIYTMGREQPYALLSDQNVVDDALKGPHRTLLSKPHCCPQEVYNIIHQHCWSSNPNERAHFNELYQLLVQVEEKFYI